MERIRPLILAGFLFAVLCFGCGDSGTTGPGDVATIRIVSPTSGSTIAGLFDIRIQVNVDRVAADEIRRIELVFDDAVTMVDSIGFPAGWDGSLTFPLPTDELPEGAHTALARVTDVAGNRFESSEVSMFILNALNYTDHIQPIFTNNCALSGCHNDATAQQNLRLGSYEGVLAGSVNGSVVVPVNADKSPVIFFLEREDDSSLRMPKGSPPLDDGTLSLIRKWIDGGARNGADEMPFQNVTDRIFNTNQGTDAITVLDRETGLTIRVIPVGISDHHLEVPHFLISDNAAEFFYVTLIQATPSIGELWKFSAEDYTFVAKTQVGPLPAHVIVTDDGTRAFISNWDTGGGTQSVQVVDTETMEVTQVLTVGSAPHGMRITHAPPYMLYVGNSKSDNVTVISLDDLSVVQTIPLMKDEGETNEPLQIAIDRDDRYAYVSCHSSHEVQVIDIAAGAVIKRISLQRNPGEVVGPFQLEASPRGDYVVTANQLNSTVSVISTDSLALVLHITDPQFAQCHGIDISEDGTYAYVTNENTAQEVPPHHPTEGGGIPGFVAFINLNTFFVDNVVEVEEDPTGISIIPGLGN